jgi:hypothetical protein
MNKEQVYSIWAPDESPWSRWAKPVLFAHLDSSEISATEDAGDVSWAPPPGGDVALVLDLPGAEGVLAGVALAGRGYRPVPLYNAVPLPSGESFINPINDKPLAAVNVRPILVALKEGSEKLGSLSLPSNAPPAFLLDANRRGGERKMERGEFDNRSLSFATDFPSANYLASHGIQRVLLIQKSAIDPQPDLAHSLRRWQDGGLRLERLRLDPYSKPESFEVPRPSWYGAVFQRLLARLRLRRASGGGFGDWISPSSAGG